METRITSKTPQMILYYINKKLREVVEGIFVNDPGLAKVKNLLDTK
jgi:hypothetical protein